MAYSLIEAWVNDLIFDTLDCGNVISAELVFEQDTTKTKIRPMLVIDHFDGKLYGFQITGTPPTEQVPEKFEIEHWEAIGLSKQSYINYDHLVSVDQQPVEGVLSDINLDDLKAFKARLTEDKDYIWKYKVDDVCKILDSII